MASTGISNEGPVLDLSSPILISSTAVLESAARNFNISSTATEKISEKEKKQIVWTAINGDAMRLDFMTHQWQRRDQKAAMKYCF